VWFNLKVLNQTWRTYMVIPSKLWTRHEEQTSSIYMVIPSKCFEPDMKYWQIKHTGWFNPKFLNQISSRQAEHTGCFHPKVLNQTWRTDNLNIQGDSIQKFWTRHEVLTTWTYRAIPSKSFEPDMKYWQIEHTGWFNPKVLNQTSWTYTVIPSKFWTRQVEYKGRFHPKVLNQTWSTDKLNIKGDSIQTFWTRQVLTNWTYRKIQSKSLESDKKNKQVEHTGWFDPKVLYQTLSTDKLNIQDDSIQKFWTRHEVLTN
jgi:hypothetical protein